MRKGPAIVVAIAAVLACAGVVRAHHSLRMIEISTPIWVKGIVVSYAPGQPHTMIELEEQTDGSRWTVEGPFPGRLERIHKLNGLGADQAFLKAGDRIEVCGFPPKKTYAVERSYPQLKPSQDRFVHGHVIVMPDGRMYSWGPYGKMDNCIRPGDQIPTWVEFLNRDTLARDLWCSGQKDPRIPSVAPAAFVEDVNRRMDSGCK
jgi:Family of unknown function (DUF6152)